MRILVVDDEKTLVKGMKFNLENEGYEVEAAYDGVTAVDLARRESFDLIILDWMMPGKSGSEACMEIRTFSDVPVIMLTAKSEDSDKIMGFACGADDYVTKPFSPSELVARVDALHRRVTAARTREEVSYLEEITSGDFVLDENRRVLLKAGQPIELTQVEFQIMELFFRNPGTALVREKILKGVWGENYFGDVKIVDVNIRRLRMKVEDEPSHPTHIMTVWGYGYRWEE